MGFTKSKVLKDYKDKHRGIGFVAGAGPSLRHININNIKDFPIIAVNSAFSKFRDIADYFVADDIGVKNWNYYTDLLPKSNATAMLYGEKLEGHYDHLDPEKLVLYKHKWWHDPKNKTYNPDGLVMTKDEPIIGARTSVGSAVHIAYILGFDPIVLLGCDCCYDDRRRYYWQFDGEEACYRITGEAVFSFPNRGEHKGAMVDAHSMDFLDYWERLAAQSKLQNINIINASGGILDCFDRMDLDDILRNYV